MKSDVVFKQAFNSALDLLVVTKPGQPLQSENALAAALGVSRTTVRKVLHQFVTRGFVIEEEKRRLVVVAVPAGAHFPQTETVSAAEQVEGRFMEWMLRGDAKPGSQINELDLARQFGVGTTAIREFLNRFRRVGLIEKRAKSGWLFKGFNETFAMELFEIREMFELRSAAEFARLPKDAAPWAALKDLRREHHDLLAAIEDRFHDFSDLDNRFHRLINEVKPNRFIADFYDVIALIFHYHYQWNKRDERQRNQVAIEEHLAYIDALLSQDPIRIEMACRQHLHSAKFTLTRAFSST